jgi:hypothetical protein
MPVTNKTNTVRINPNPGNVKPISDSGLIEEGKRINV